MQKPTFNIKSVLITVFLFWVHLPFASASSEIHKVLLHEYNDTTYLILHLFNFHPTGGSYEKGNLRTTGYNDSEIRIINLNTQKTISYKKFGEYNYEGAFEILGGSGNHIWMYSMEQKSGLQALNIYTLEPEVTQAKIYAQMDNWTGRFYEPDWRNINSYYNFNQFYDKLCITNYKDQVFGIDPTTFEVFESEKHKIQKQTYLWKVVYEGMDTIDLYDEYIHVNNLKQIPDHHFIEGSFLIEQNPKIQYAHYQESLINFTSELEQASDKLARIRAKEGSETYNKLNQQKKWLTSKTNDIKDNLKAIEENRKPDKILLRTNDNAFYVLQRYNTDQNTPIAIAKVAQKKSHLSVEWITPIPNMYYNISAVQDLPAFKRYFNNIVPDPSFFYIQQIEQKLLIVYLMQVCIIDTQTGQISWKTKL